MADENITVENENQQNEQQNPNPAPEKTFTQADVDSIVARRLAKAQKGMPDEAELSAFRTWKETHQTEQQKYEAATRERDAVKSDLAAAQARIEQYERERYLLSKGISADDVDYYAYKAGKLVNDNTSFEQAVETVIRERSPQGDKVRVDTGAPLFGRAQTPKPNDTMNALIRNARK